MQTTTTVVEPEELQTSTGEYDVIYEKLQEFYKVNVKGIYPYNIPLNEDGNPIYRYESKLSIINFDEECKDDISKGVGFYITKKQDIKKDIRSEDSIFSPRYGLQIDDMMPFGDIYKCQCGKTMMKVHNGTFCPFCHKKVKYVSNDFQITGWMKMDDHMVIQPAMFKKLVGFIGAKKLDDILKFDVKVDENGFIVKKEAQKNNPYVQLGMKDFIENFDEIMEYFRSKNKSNKNKMEYYEDIMNNKDKVFCHCLPVYTSQLRPYSIKGTKFNFEGNNASFNVIAGMVAKLNQEKICGARGRKKPVNQVLYEIQMKYMKIYTDLDKVIAQKKGYIRSLNGGRYNFTARNVIIPDPHLRIDEIILPYSTLIELLSLTIINILSKTYAPSEAYRIWDEARIEYDPMVADLIKTILKSQYVGIILNRNPSISPASIIQLHVVGVSRDNTYSCHVPHEILKSMGADFDGDTLNAMLIINDDFLMSAAMLFNPRLSMQISYNDGMFNNRMTLQTDTMICLNSFTQMGIDSITPEEYCMIDACQNCTS